MLSTRSLKAKLNRTMNNFEGNGEFEVINEIPNEEQKANED